ncbi:MAG TPA: hypothetical protein VEF76_12485 [Patescibacteria group bacterium]|nr:hypothetical protein [Patescibacteria group bacterium]
MTIPSADDRLRASGLGHSAAATGPELQDAIYRAARENDTASVAQLLKDMFESSDLPRADLPGYFATIDSVTPRMTHMSLVVLSLQAGAMGLFRFLAEQKPEETKRIASAILPVMGGLDFVRPLVALGADPSFMAGALAAGAVQNGDLALVAFMAEYKTDFNSTAHMHPPRHVLGAAGGIADLSLRCRMTELLLANGARWDAMEGPAREQAQAAYNESRQGEIAQETLRQLKEKSRGLRPRAL